MLLGDMSKSSVFSRSPLYGILIVILMSSLFSVFSHGLLVKEIAATSGKISQCIVYRWTHGAFHLYQERFRCCHSAGHC